MCPLPQTHKHITQIKPIAVQEVNLQATAFGQVICLDVFWLSKHMSLVFCLWDALLERQLWPISRED